MAKKRFYAGEDAVMAKKSYGKSLKKDMKYAREKEMNEDSHMIHDDWSAPALLPQRVIDRDWPRNDNYMKYGEADLFMGVQKQLDEDGRDMRRENKPKKY